MELFKLDPYTFLPEATIDRYSSLIWTERYDDPGEFELRMNDIENAMTFLPINTFISHADTREMMMVETHEIKTDDSGLTTLVIKGSSVINFLRFRSARNERYNNDPGTFVSDQVGALNRAFMHIMGLSSQPEEFSGLYFDYWRRDQLPVKLRYSRRSQFSTTYPGAGIETLYDYIKTIVSIGQVGFASRRPLATDPEEPWGPFKRKIEFFFHDAEIRSLENFANPIVQFDVRAGHFNDASYLWTYDNRYTHIYLFTGVRPEAGVSYIHTADSYSVLPAPNPSDYFNRRVLVKHDSSITDVASARPRMSASAEAEFKISGRTFYFEGGLALNAPYQYGTDYWLGDSVILRGEYGSSITAIVSEFVRTEDKDGDRGFPTFVQRI